MVIKFAFSLFSVVSITEHTGWYCTWGGEWSPDHPVRMTCLYYVWLGAHWVVVPPGTVTGHMVCGTLCITQVIAVTWLLSGSVTLIVTGQCEDPSLPADQGWAIRLGFRCLFFTILIFVLVFIHHCLGLFLFHLQHRDRMMN